MALWQLYGGVSTSVAVEVCTARLIETATHWDEDVFLHKVNYIDHVENPDMIGGRYTSMFEYKHKAYEYQQEVE